MLNSWLKWDQPQPNILLVRYEEILEDPATELMKMVDFIGIAVSREKILNAVEIFKI